MISANNCSNGPGDVLNANRSFNQLLRMADVLIRAAICSLPTYRRIVGYLS